MLLKFTVSNYRGFKNAISIDMTDVREYKFNEECVKDEVINKSILYGKNAVGKTNIGSALMDIKGMILSNTTVKRTDLSFLHADSSDDFARFEYVFLIDNKKIEYIYEKTSPDTLKFECLTIDHKKIYDYDFDVKKGNFDALRQYEELKHLNFSDWNNEISILKYVLSNAKLSELDILINFREFVNGMAYLRPSDHFVSFYGPSLIKEGMIKTILEEDLVQDFESFLAACGIHLPLTVDVTPEGERRLYINYKRSIEFIENVSSGTKVLTSLYIILKNIDKLNFLFIDEFDANLHFELAEKIISKLKEKQDTQMIVTTHNTDLMNNKLMRPDTYFIMRKDRITTLANSTKRELRMGHNLEKLYQSGEFDVLGCE